MLASEVHHFTYFEHILQQTGVSPLSPLVQIAAPASIRQVSLALAIQYSVPQGQRVPQVSPIHPMTLDFSSLVV
jgi:hypothetical protein